MVVSHEALLPLLLLLLLLLQAPSHTWALRLLSTV
jgi:hypothetical protein